MGANDSKLVEADRNAAIKLIFPTHGMPFIIPFSVVPSLVPKVDEIIKNMRKKRNPTQAPLQLRLPSGLVLDCPSIDDWVLVDVGKNQLIPRDSSTIRIMVVEGGTYMVLSMAASGLTEAQLREAIETVNTGREDPPGYVDHPSSPSSSKRGEV